MQIERWSIGITRWQGQPRIMETRAENSSGSNRLTEQLKAIFPAKVSPKAASHLSRFSSIFLPFSVVIAMVLLVIGAQFGEAPSIVRDAINSSLWSAYFALSLISGVVAWFLVLEQESRRAAQEQSNVQTQMLIREIEAHEKTGAQLEKAKDRAESANVAKTRYVVGISHELRTP